MRLVIFFYVFLILISSFSTNDRFEVGNCIFKDKKQYKVIDVTSDSYVLSNNKIVFFNKKSVTEKEFIKGYCR